MDRRTFLKTTTAAAAATTATAGAARGASLLNEAPPLSGTRHQPASAPALGRTRHEFQIALPPQQSPAPAIDAARLLSRDITSASDGRIVFHLTEHEQASPGAIAAGRSDGAFGLLSDIISSPALSVFSGTPGSTPPASVLLAWYEAGAAAMYLDESAADFGLTALIAGHSGNTTGLWSDRPILGLADFLAANIASPGLGSNVIETLRKTHQPHDDRENLPQPATLIEQPCGPLQSTLLHPPQRIDETASDSPRAAAWYRHGIHTSGHAIHLVLADHLWHALAAGDQLLIRTMTRAAAHSDLARNEVELSAIAPAVLASASIAVEELPPEVRTAIDAAALQTVAAIIETAPAPIQRAWRAWQGFSGLLEADGLTAQTQRSTAS